MPSFTAQFSDTSTAPNASVGRMLGSFRSYCAGVPMPDEVDGVVLTGVFGSGKSSVAAEIAELLERNHVAYGAVDLDWLMWFHVPGLSDSDSRRVYLDNVANVTSAYRRAGVRHVVFAVALRDQTDFDEMRAASGLALRVVRLVVPLEVVVRRLEDDPTTGRRDDLATARQWFVDSTGVGIEDLAVSNEGTVHDVARQIVEWLAWTR